MQSCDLNPCRLLPFYSFFMWEANCSDNQGQEIHHRIRQTQLALVFLIIGCTSRTQKGKLFPVPQKTSKKKKTYKNATVDKMTSCYLFLSEAEQREREKTCFDSMVSAHHGRSLGTLLGNLYLRTHLLTFGSPPTRSQLTKAVFFRRCAPNTDTRRVIQKSNYCKTQAGGSIS